MLVATVGTNDGTNITLTMNGTQVTHLTAGTYAIQVRDNSMFHNFHRSWSGYRPEDRDRFQRHANLDGDVHRRGLQVRLRPARELHERQLHRRHGAAATFLPPPPPKCKVPKVVGRKLPMARRMITRAYCRVGRVRRAESRRPRGRIVKQSPRWGVKRARGARVSLVVSRGKR